MLRLALLTTLMLCVFGVSAQNPDTEKSWQAMLKSGPRKMKVPRTLVYSRAQFKYNAQLNYIGRWVDTPLLVDPELNDNNPETRLSSPNFHKMQETVISYGMDGLACLPGKTGSDYLYKLCAKTPVPGFTLIPELQGSRLKTDEGIKILETVIVPALNSPHSLKIDGKLLVSSYGGGSSKEWKKLFDRYREKYGDKFIFLPQIGAACGKYFPYWQGRYKSGAITPEDIEKIKADFREIIRDTDGLYLTAWAIQVEGERRFATDFYRDFIIGIGKSVISEPEFKNKYFALVVRVGHENCTRIGGNLSCYGTSTFRESMETAMAAKPDIIIIPEWDEQNENTSLRPTVYNSFSSKRLMRYYMAKLKNEQPAPVPGDDMNIPNLIMSYRKTLCAGERINVELLNVPDSDKNTEYTVELSFHDINGKEVIKFPAVKFNSSELNEHRFFEASENYVSHQVLLPKLKINYKGKDLTFEDGFQYLELRGTWNWDYKWVKQPLRDMLKPLKADFKMTGKDAFTVDFASGEELAYVELLDENAVIYTAQKAGEMIWRETPEHKVIAFYMQNMPNHENTLNGSITINGKGIKWLTDNSYSWPTDYPSVSEGNTYAFKDFSLSLTPRKIYAAIPVEFTENAIIEINLPGFFVQKIPVKQILATEIYGVPGMGTPTLTLSRFMRQAFHPKHLKAREAYFSAGILPDMPRSIIHMQAIAESGKIYRSKPIILNSEKNSGKNGIITVYSDTVKKPVSVTAPSWQIPDIEYRINPDTGTVITCAAGRMLWGLCGGYAAQATWRGASEARDTTAFISIKSYPKEAVKSAAEIVEKDGSPAWTFDGIGEHLVFPAGAIPRRSAFTLSFDVFLENPKGKQILVSNRSHILGSLELFMEDGKLKGIFLDNLGNQIQLNSGLAVETGKWSSVKVVYNLSEMLFHVNEQASAKLPCPGPGRNDTTTVVGGYDKNWFKGFIKNLKIKHSADN